MRSGDPAIRSRCPRCDGALDGPLDGARPLPDVDRNCPTCGIRLLPIIAASCGQRMLAAATDTVVLSLTAGPLHLALSALMDSPPLAPGAKGLDALLQIGTRDLSELAGHLVPFLLMCTLYFALFVGLTGRTPGLRLLRLRVVSTHGVVPGPLVAAWRFVAAIGGLLPGALGWVWMAVDTDRRTWHDHLSGTYVVREA